MTNRNGSKPGAIANEFRTNDLYFAAYLQVAGASLIRTDREPGGSKVFFVFDSSVANIDELRVAWFNNAGRIPAQPYANAIKSLKSACFMA